MSCYSTHPNGRGCVRLLAAFAVALGVQAAPVAAAEIKIGSIATLEGPFAAGGKDSYRALELALAEVNFEVAGKKIVWTRESSNAQADVALARARKLIEQDGVDIVIGPLSGAEGVALRDYSRTLKGKTFVNGASGGADTTLRNPSPNFFRFNPDGIQWFAGVGSYVYKTLGVKEVALVASDYAFGYAQVFGFMHEYCALGGKVTKLWAPLNTTDFSSTVASIPKGAGAIVAVQAGTDALAFLTQYAQGGGKLPLIGGTLMADQTLMSARGPHRALMNGMVSAGPTAEIHDEPSWTDFVKRYRERFPDGYPTPSINAFSYYVNARAVLLALAKVDGDLSNDQSRFQEALRTLEFKTPMGGTIRLDENRQAISDVYLVRVVERGGALTTETFGKTAAVNQTLGTPREAFLALGAPSRDNPSCPPAN